MTEQELRALIAGGETLTVEFKSDLGPLSDSDLIEAVACLANRQGGVLLIGVEDDGRVTGLHPRHRTGPESLAAFVASRTVPPVTVEAAFFNLSEGQVAQLTIPPAFQPVSTSDGRLLIRYLDVHSRPGCRPLYAYELSSWLGERGRTDTSSTIVPFATWGDLDPLEFVRLRRMVEENVGDQSLLELSDPDIARALGLIQRVEDRVVPTVAGLLLVGKEEVLRERIPAHEVAFQVLHGTDVKVNEFRRWPLLRGHEWLIEAISVRNEEQELLVNGGRVAVPRYDRAGVREAINNALIHRDYTSLGAVHVQLHDDYLRVGNPGGFPVGVRPDNLLTADPRPRNPTLADAFKRIGLVEKTGRGTSIIYIGQLRNGRRPPNYAHSGDAGVLVMLDSGPADLDFVRTRVHANRRLERALRVEELLALWMAWQQGTVTPAQLAPVIQRTAVEAASLLQAFADTDMLHRISDGYHLPFDLVPASRRPAIGPDDIIMDQVRRRGKITRREAVAVTGLEDEQARYQLRKLVAAGLLEQAGTGRDAYYRVPQRERNGESSGNSPQIPR